MLKIFSILLKLCFSSEFRFYFREELKWRFFKVFGFPLQWNLKRILHLELTSKCNLLCKACYRAGELASFMETDSQMSIEQLKCLIGKYHPFQITSVILSGGENLLHPDFDKMVQIIHSKFPGAPITLSTNGIVLYQNEELLNCLLKLPIDFLQISLHGATQKTIDFLQNGVKIEKSLLIAEKIKTQSLIDVSFNFVVQEENIQEMNAFIELIATKTSIKKISFTPMNFAGHVKGCFDYNALWKRISLRERLEEVYQQGEKMGFSVSRISTSCLSVLAVDVFTAKGNMLYCWGNYLVKKYSLGNALKKNPFKLRLKKEFKSFFKKIKNSETPELCKACWANGQARL